MTLTALVLVTWQWRVAATAQREQEKLVVNLALGQVQGLCEKGEVGRGLLWMAHTLALTPEDNADMQRVVRANLAAWSRPPRSVRDRCSSPSHVPRDRRRRRRGAPRWSG